MSEVIYINNIFSMGHRCNADEFLRIYLKIRKYSSPFSYMVIDLKTALQFIDTNFENYTNMEYIQRGNYTYKFNKQAWRCKTFIHKNARIPNNDDEILDLDRVCIWNHHDLYDQNTVNSINRRSLHLLECLKNKSNTTLLFYIEKIQVYEKNKECYFDRSILDKYNCKFLIFIPLLNYNSDPLLFYEDSQIRIIYFNSNLESWGTDTACHVEEWNKLVILINKLYTFDIENRNDD
jgi:hypothetical protein